MKYCSKLLIIGIILFNLNKVYAQSINKNQTNAEYVKQLIDLPEVERVFIVALNKYFEYDKEWLDKVEISGDYITFVSKKEKKTHVWYIKNLVFLEKFDNVIKVRLNESVGN